MSRRNPATETWIRHSDGTRTRVDGDGRPAGPAPRSSSGRLETRGNRSGPKSERSAAPAPAKPTAKPPIRSAPTPPDLVDAERRLELLSAPPLRDATGVQVRREPLTYEREGRHSFLWDLIQASFGTGADGAEDRLARHQVEMNYEYARRDRQRRAQFDAAAAAGRWQEARDLSTVDGAGGEFAPPLHLTDLFAPLARTPRVLADLARQIPLPTGTDSISIPRLTTGTQMAMQATDNAAVAEQDLVSTGIVCPVRTVAGMQDVSLGFAEQAAPMAFDEVLFTDLSMDYNAKLEDQLLNGSGVAPNLTGKRVVAGTHAVTYTDASPTLPEMQVKVADAASRAATSRKLPVTAILVAPRRWYWLTAQADPGGRPYMLPSTDVPPSDGLSTLVGSICGVRTYLDAGLPLTSGGGTEDEIVVTRPEDDLLFESLPRLRVNLEPGSGTLTARVTLHYYVAWTGGRYPAGTAIVAGTGLAAPIFG